MKPALSQVCSLPSPFEKDVEDYAAGHCNAIELWLTKLETYLESHSTGELRNLLAAHDLVAPIASFQGGLLTSQSEVRRAAWRHFEQRLDLCREIGTSTIVVACDVAPPLSQQDVERVQQSLNRLAEAARKRAIRAALEFQARAAFGNNLETAAALIAEVNSPHLGLCLDAFHYYVGPSKPEDLRYLNKDNLFHVQLSDLADTPREFATDANRILPGDGDLPLSPIVDFLRSIEYSGYISIELMNPSIWQVPPLQFGEIAMTALQRLLGLDATNG